MLTLRPSTVPLYLQSSRLYRSLDAQVDAELSVPSTAYKDDLSIASESDLSLLLSTLAFWRSEECFVEIIDYVYNTLRREVLRRMSDEYGQVWELRYIKSLRHVRENPHENPLNKALYDGYLEIAMFLRKKGFTCDHDSLYSALTPVRIEFVRFVIQDRQSKCLALCSIDQLTVLSENRISIRPPDVPTFLHSSELYKSLDLENDDVFEVPIVNYKLDQSVDSFMDLVLLFDTLDYWGLDGIFPEIVRFVYKEYIRVDQYQRVERKLILQNYARKWKYINTLMRIVE